MVGYIGKELEAERAGAGERPGVQIPSNGKSLIARPPSTRPTPYTFHHTSIAAQAVDQTFQTWSLGDTDDPNCNRHPKYHKYYRG